MMGMYAHIPDMIGLRPTSLFTFTADGMQSLPTGASTPVLASINQTPRGGSTF